MDTRTGELSDVYGDCSVLTCRPIDLEIAALRLVFKLMEQLRPDHEDNPFYCDFGEAPVDGTCIADLLDARDKYVGDIIPLLAQRLVTDREWMQKYRSLYVCGPAMGGVTLAYEVARQLCATAIFTTPVYALGNTGEVEIGNPPEIVKTGQQLKRFKIPDGATILFVEDVITTGKCTREMIRAVRGFCMENLKPDGPNNDMPNFLPYVLCLVNRSGNDKVETKEHGPDVGSFYYPKILSLTDVPSRTCAAGTEIDGGVREEE